MHIAVETVQLCRLRLAQAERRTVVVGPPGDRDVARDPVAVARYARADELGLVVAGRLLADLSLLVEPQGRLGTG